jgi:hypothetical protein
MSTTLEFYRGDSWPFTVDTITDLSGNAVTDVSAWACNWTLRDLAGNAVARASTTSADGVTTISRGSGLFSWIVPPATTEEIDPEYYQFDTELTDGSGNKQTDSGIIKVLADQTT